MKLKTLLLSSATAFAVVGGAQAADLSIAEPVDYVRVCDAFGVGYWYIPGTDTCIAIGGRVRFQVNFHENSGVYSYSHSSTWHFTTNARISVDARSMTEHGELRGFVRLTSTFDDPSDVHDHMVYLDQAWLQLGMVTAGKLGSVQNVDGGFDDWGGFHPDVEVQQVRLAWAASGFGVMIGIEDPRIRWGTDLPVDYTMPDITGRLTATMGHVDAIVTAGFGDLNASNGDGVYGIAGALQANLDPFKVRIGGSFGTGSRFVSESVAASNGDNNWAVFASATAPLGPTLAVNGTVAYAATDGGAGHHEIGVGGDLVWSPVTGFSAMLHAGGTSYDDADWAWAAFGRLERTW